MSTGFLQLISAQQGKAQLMDEEAGDLAKKIKDATAEQKNLRAMTRTIDKMTQDHELDAGEYGRLDYMMGANGFDGPSGLSGQETQTVHHEQDFLWFHWEWNTAEKVNTAAPTSAGYGDWSAKVGGAPDDQTAVNNEKAINRLKDDIDAKQKDVEADLKSLDFDVQGASADYKAALEGASNSIKLISDVNSGVRQKTA